MNNLRTRLRFTEGQEVSLLRVTDNADIVSKRVISKVTMTGLEFKGLKGHYEVRGAEGNLLINNNKVLELLPE